MVERIYAARKKEGQLVLRPTTNRERWPGHADGHWPSHSRGAFRKTAFSAKRAYWPVNRPLPARSRTTILGPFGEVIRATGPLAKVNPIRFSTKYDDDESDLLYYGHRCYKPSTGTWLSRDPGAEEGGHNLYGLLNNNPISETDFLGLWATDVHHQLVVDWLTERDPETDYHSYPWRCCTIDVIALLQHGSDLVDGVVNGWASVAFCEAQESRKSYQHAMRDGHAGQSEDAARALYTKFLNEHNDLAKGLSDIARLSADGCSILRKALVELGSAYHSYSDSLSPAHEGFQPWWGPIDGINDMGLWNYEDFVSNHEQRETFQVYESKYKSSAIKAVRAAFDADLKYILSQ